jgi:hypothetical protein
LALLDNVGATLAWTAVPFDRLSLNITCTVEPNRSRLSLIVD